MTSLTNNVLTFNNGSIKDVRNELNCALPISVNQSQTFKYSSSAPRTATISGSPGVVVIKTVNSGGSNSLKISSNGGTWIYKYATDDKGWSSDIRTTVNLRILPWSIDSASVGAINLSLNPVNAYGIIAVIAYRLY